MIIGSAGLVVPGCAYALVAKMCSTLTILLTVAIKLLIFRTGNHLIELAVSPHPAVCLALSTIGLTSIEVRNKHMQLFYDIPGFCID